MNKLVLGAAAALLGVGIAASANAVQTTPPGTLSYYGTGEGCVWVKLSSVPNHWFTVGNPQQHVSPTPEQLARGANFDAMRDQLLSVRKNQTVINLYHDGIPDNDCYDAGGSRILGINDPPL